MTADPSAIDQVIAARRTSLLVDADRPVADHLIDEVIEAATWAPNHKRTWPWRFTVISGDARSRFGETLAAAGGALGLKAAKVEKMRTKYLRSPVLVVVWVAVDTDEVRAREDRDATAAAVQNLLLAATARGLASYWGTLSDALFPGARAACVVGDDHNLVALVYLGWPTGEVAVPERPAPDVTRLA
ncbi:MAG: nitroreductase family protein [Acidimicrobiales bacterium]